MSTSYVLLLPSISTYHHHLQTTVRDALPNPNHFSLAALQYTGHVTDIITQNVDSLHHKASPWDTAPHDSKDIPELHGTLFRVRCAKGHVIPRDTFQDMISTLNPFWKQVSDDVSSGLAAFRTNPDGDVSLCQIEFPNLHYLFFFFILPFFADRAGWNDI